MENKINLPVATNSYILYFQKAQMNLAKLVEEERLRKRIGKSKQRLSKAL